MNLTKSSVDVYNMKGVLHKKLSFKKIREDYGKPKAVSNNGTCFIF
jgi:hypothetical protein